MGRYFLEVDQVDETEVVVDLIDGFRILERASFDFSVNLYALSSSDNSG